MPFQIICMKNKQFWSKFVSVMCGFALVIAAMVIVFPTNNTDTSQTIQTQTTTTTAEASDSEQQ